MTLLADVLVACVVLLHVYILVLEMFLWTTPRARAAFGVAPDLAESTRTMAANQGLYNGFLAAGLVWGLLAGGDLRVPVLTFFLACVAVAGGYGAATVNRRILLVQTVPAALALAAVLAAR